MFAEKEVAEEHLVAGQRLAIENEGYGPLNVISKRKSLEAGEVLGLCGGLELGLGVGVDGQDLAHLRVVNTC